LHVPGVAQPETASDGLPRQPGTARQVEATPTMSGLFLSEVKSHPKGVTLGVAIIALVIGTAGIGLYKLVRLAQRSESFQTMRLAKLTSTGNVGRLGVAVSPDGKYLAYATSESGQQSLWVRHVATSSNVQIVAPADVGYQGLIFSPDGSYVYYSIKKGGLATLYQVPVLGGQSRKLIEDAGPVTFSPDGSRLGFIRGDGRTLMIANADGTGVQTLAMRTGGETWRAPTWSPDGRVIASGVFSPTDNNCRLVEVAVKDGTEKPITGPPWLQVTGMTWLPDGSGLALSGGDPETKLSQIWLVSYPDGKAHKVTNDLNNYTAVSLTADGKTLATIQGDRISNIWVAPGGDANLARKITFEIGRDDGLSGLSWTPDSRIVYSARIAGTFDLWIVDQDGSNNRQLTFNARNNYSASVTPDGRYITFVSDRGGNNNIWRMDLDGSNAKQLTNSPGIAQSPDCSPDSKWVVYQITRDQKTTIWKVSIDDGDQIQLTNEYSVDPAVSPDGKSLACAYGEPKADATAKLAIIPFAGGPPARLLDLPNVVKSRSFRWTVDGRGLIYRDSRDRVSNLWSQPLDVSPPKQLTDFKAEEIFWFEWSRDGKGLALARGHMGSDVVMINNFR
jgi:Tol biopolymer transport system component